ncbi:MAG: energy transducer TonB [Xanthomonadales bacterium]|nr:energy transducer TonB [Xanthomonadales bacterium]
MKKIICLILIITQLNSCVSNRYKNFGDREAYIIVLIEPTYPRKALIDNIEGIVEVEFTVSSNAEIKDFEIILSTPIGIFENAMIEAIKKSKFEPKVFNGKYVDSRMTIKHVFRLE